MAKEAKKDSQELTVEQKLKALFQLQTPRRQCCPKSMKSRR